MLALSESPTRTLARPVVLLLSHGFMHAYFTERPETTAPRASGAPHDFGKPEVFLTQTSRAKRKVVALAALVGSLIVAGSAYLLG
jgi:hypothetical protein